MAQAHYVKKCRKNIYVHGLTVTYISRKGKRVGQKLQRLDRTKPANKQDTVLITKGVPYYYWQFKNGPIIFSPTRPRRSQLTRSEFLGSLYDLEDEIGDFKVAAADVAAFSEDDLRAQIKEWVSQIEEIMDGCQERLDAMPDSLRDSSVNNERVEGLEAWIDELESAETELDEEDMHKQASNEWQAENTSGTETGAEAWIGKRLLELKKEKIEELLADLQGLSSGLG